MRVCVIPRILTYTYVYVGGVVKAMYANIHGGDDWTLNGINCQWILAFLMGWVWIHKNRFCYVCHVSLI
jgi:hypothetical protein